jgi:hypothetical protein
MLSEKLKEFIRENHQEVYGILEAFWKSSSPPHKFIAEGCGLKETIATMTKQISGSEIHSVPIPKGDWQQVLNLLKKGYFVSSVINKKEDRFTIGDKAIYASDRITIESFVIEDSSISAISDSVHIPVSLLEVLPSFRTTDGYQVYEGDRVYFVRPGKDGLVDIFRHQNIGPKGVSNYPQGTLLFWDYETAINYFISNIERLSLQDFINLQIGKWDTKESILERLSSHLKKKLGYEKTEILVSSPSDPIHSDHGV